MLKLKCGVLTHSAIREIIFGSTTSSAVAVLTLKHPDPKTLLSRTDYLQKLHLCYTKSQKFLKKIPIFQIENISRCTNRNETKPSCVTQLRAQSLQGSISGSENQYGIWWQPFLNNRTKFWELIQKFAFHKWGFQVESFIKLCTWGYRFTFLIRRVISTFSTSIGTISSYFL